MRYLIAVLLVLITIPVEAGFAQHPQEADKRVLALQKEQEKYKRMSDPVNRTLSDINIARVLIELISDAVKTGNDEAMNKRVAEYVSTIQDAHHIIMNTGKDAHKKSQGFKELEIALRKQAKELKDIGDALTLDQREPLEKARQIATNLHDDLFRALFGS